MIRFRTATGSLYTFDGVILTRLSERPVEGLDPRPSIAEPIGEIQVGARARFATQGGALTTSPVVEVLS